MNYPEQRLAHPRQSRVGNGPNDIEGGTAQLAARGEPTSVNRWENVHDAERTARVQTMHTGEESGVSNGMLSTNVGDTNLNSLVAGFSPPNEVNILDFGPEHPDHGAPHPALDHRAEAARGVGGIDRGPFRGDRERFAAEDGRAVVTDRDGYDIARVDLGRDQNFDIAPGDYRESADGGTGFGARSTLPAAAADQRQATAADYRRTLDSSTPLSRDQFASAEDTWMNRR